MSASASLRATVVVGNPKPASRTRHVGLLAAAAVLEYAGTPAPETAVDVIELSALSGSLFSWGDLAVGEAKSSVLAADLVVVASPVYKASYTGLLKSFLDQFGRDELGALAVVPLMVGAAPIHSLAVESQLRPVLVEIGASCPTRGLYVLEQEVDRAAESIAEWLAVWGDALAAVMTSSTRRKETIT
jgi:FMN reductase